MPKPIFFILAILPVAILFECSRPKKERIDSSSLNNEAVSDTLQPAVGATAAAVADEPQFSVDKTFQQQLGNVLSSYLILKEAFVASDSAQVSTTAKGVRESLQKVELKLLTGQALHQGKKYIPSLEKAVNEIQEHTNLDQQRKAFQVLSDSLYITVKAFGLGGKEVYYEFCPMAFNEEGAFWLSDQEKIRNPYFGNKMLTCGEVKEKLK